MPYFHLDGDCGCVFWIPLNKVRAGGGRIGYIPGSHRWRKMFKANVFVSELPFPGAEGVDMPRIDADPEAYGVEYLEAEPGDVLVHHFLTVHGSEGNRSDTPRGAFSSPRAGVNMKRWLNATEFAGISLSGSEMAERVTKNGPLPTNVAGQGDRVVPLPGHFLFFPSAAGTRDPDIPNQGSSRHWR